MTALAIIGAVLLLVLLLLLIPVSVNLSAAGDNYSVLLRYGLLRKRLFPEAPSSKTKPAKVKKTEKAPSGAPVDEKKPKKRDTKELIHTGFMLLKSSRRGLNSLRRHLVVSRVRIYISVGGEDAHQAALRYSQVSLAVTAALDIVGLLFVLKSPQVGIAPHFTRPDTHYDCAARISIRPLFAVGAALSVLFRFLLQPSSQRSTDSPKRRSQRKRAA